MRSGAATCFQGFLRLGAGEEIYTFLNYMETKNICRCVVGEITAYLVITQLGPMFEPALISKATAHWKQQVNHTESSPFSLKTAQKLSQMLPWKPQLHCPRPFSATLNQSASTYPRFHVGPGSICLISAGWFVL